MNPYILVLVVIFFVVSAQMIVKAGVATLYYPKAFSAYELVKMAVLNLTNPYVVASLFFTLIAGLTWLLVLKRIPLSRAYPLISLNYIAVCMLSWALFNEHIAVSSLGGIGCIVLGTILLGLR